MKKEKINYEKYGFVLEREDPNGYKVFTKIIDDKRFIQLSVINNTVTLSDFDMQFKGREKMVIACRYKIEQQKELDFIIYKGRVGFLFI